jgi:gliding motility-associated-like protein
MKIHRLHTLLLAMLMVLMSTEMAFATHNRAGSIWIEQIGPLSIRATIITYTKASSVAADRDTLELNWGDGTPVQKVARSNGGGRGIFLAGDIRYNEYVATYTYPGRGTYVVSMTDPNRNGGILNVNFPNSDVVPFYIQTVYTFLNSNFQGTNTTPRLLQPPIDKGCVGKTYIYNVNAYDPDGDSIAYRLITPYQDKGITVPLYEFPDRINTNPPKPNLITLDERTGQFTWKTPQLRGEYNVAFLILSYRRGQVTPIDSTIRDIQILIEDCQNDPPKVETIDKLCVIAGQSIKFAVRGTDPNAGQKVQLSALGGPFEVKYSPAIFLGSQGRFLTPPVVDSFKWQTTCEHIAEYPYNVVFKAMDNFFDTAGLVDLKTVQIKVVGPPPEDVRVVSGSGESTVSWKQPYICEAAKDRYWYAYSVWRRESSSSFPIDICTPGLDGKGYERIVYDTIFPFSGGYYNFVDKNVERGKTYCYRVLAHFAKRTNAGNPFNFVPSLPSEEVCVQLQRDLPLITNVTVEETSPSVGRILVRWTKPVAKDLDTLLNPGPYKFVVQRAQGITKTGFQNIAGATFSSPTFTGLNDTIWLDNALNTTQFPYTYRIAFYKRNDSLVGYSPVASSHFLKIQSSDRINILTIDKDVPWTNSRYDIFRLNRTTNQYDSIGTTVTQTYTDEGLVNKTEYCYYVRAVGSYGIVGIASPLINLSQSICGTPIDTVPPCPPKLAVTNNCDSTGRTAETAIFNLLRWTNPTNNCKGSEDVAKYTVYYADTEGGQFQKIATISNINDTILSHQNVVNRSVAGCYYVTATDSLGNESPRSNVFCMDNCPYYLLPNAFTPNGDGDNEMFKPINLRFIAKVDFKVFNRWGQLVFETDNPLLNWDGKNTKGDVLADGTYFYTCKVFEQRVGGATVSPKILNGYIEMIRGN